MAHLTRRTQLLILMLFFMSNAIAYHNDATETTNTPGKLLQSTQDEPANEAANQARNGGRHPGATVHNVPEQSQVGCRELRSTKYISDGQCTSVNPIKELVCAGECLPAHLLPNWIGGGGYTGRYWSRREAQEWRCVIDRTRTQRIHLECQDGSSRTYKITVVTSCKCKRYSRQHNDSAHIDPNVDVNNQRNTGLPDESNN
ncbi:sclerostin domain-containing protein 1-like [Genypterus blacodes]|uniref:sclerostin domain-containing protein 1-like n=1 Tax=Genypterus blacodes TaxID=154954 RepID=UPI003F7579D5